MKRNLTTALLLTLLPVWAMAQVGGANILTITTNPPGAEVVLKGDLELSAVSPAGFTYPLMGEYRLVVRKQGFETYKTRILVNPQSPQQVSIDLSPRTAFKATVRSMLVPGWGQFYSGRKSRGAVLGSLFAGSMILYLSINSDFHDKDDLYRERLSDYDAAVVQGLSYDVLRGRYRLMVDAHNAAYDAEDNRRVAIATVAGVWGLSVLDALLFSPGEKAAFSVKGISLAPSSTSGSLGLTLSKAF